MYNIANLPAVRAQLEQDAAAARDKPALLEQAATVEYARAPDAGTTTATAGRPPVIQRTTR